MYVVHYSWQSAVQIASYTSKLQLRSALGCGVNSLTKIYIHGGFEQR